MKSYNRKLSTLHHNTLKMKCVHTLEGKLRFWNVLIAMQTGIQQFNWAWEKLILPLDGWSELAATNAPIADEPVEAVFRMNKNPILPARIIFFFPPLLYPKIFPLPTYFLPPLSYLPSTSHPPTYHLPTPPPLTPSPELQRLRAAVERELELWLWSGS
jgi:hypothetical protein